MFILSLFLLVILSLANAAAAEKYGCDFESPCNILNFDQYWGLTSGGVPFGPDAPNHDHTYGNSSGRYMFYDLNGGPQYRDTIISFNQIFNFTTSSTRQRCLQFYYIVDSDVSKNLTVNLVLGDNADLQQTWLTVNTQTNRTSDWSLAEVQLPLDAYWIRLKLELIYQPTPSKLLLTLDDVFVTDQCAGHYEPKEIKENKVLYWCDFEAGDCSYENTMKLQWKRTRAGDNLNNGPMRDHTFNTTNGSYLTSTPITSFGAGFIERVIGSTIVSVPGDGTPYCISFYYYISSNTPSLYLFTIPLNDTSDNATFQANNNIWPALGSNSQQYVFKKWAWGIANLVPGTFKLAFVVSNNQQFDMSMAVDDIKIHSCPAVNNPVTSYEPYLSYFFEYKCDFETDRCGFSETMNNFGVNYPSNWSRIEPKQNLYPNLGPNVDHTSGTQEGHYLTVNFSLPITSSFAALTRSPLIFAHREMCFEFYYYANTEMFSPTSKSSFSMNIGGCYATQLFSIRPYQNVSEPQWTRVVVPALNYACREFIDFGFRGGDFLRTTFAIDDFRADRCDKINNSDVTTTTTTVTTEQTSTTTIITTTETKPTTTTPVTTTEAKTTTEDTTVSTTTTVTATTTTYIQTTKFKPNSANSNIKTGLAKYFVLFFFILNTCLF